MTVASPLSGRDLTSPVPFVPEERVVFRLAQLLLLLEGVEAAGITIPSVDRLAHYEFFAANPFVVVSTDAARDAFDRTRLRLAGFINQQLSYASTGQRFYTRRQKLQNDLAILVSYGLVRIGVSGYELTDRGRQVSAQLSSVYATSYRESVDIVVRRLSRLSDKRLIESAHRWLGHSWLLIDLLDDVTESSPSTRAR